MIAERGYDKWIAENTTEYKGYLIRAGTIYKDGEPVIVFHARLAEPKEESWARGKQIIDGWENDRSGTKGAAL